MAKACPRCHTVNDSDAKVCKECGKAFPSSGGSGASRTGGGGGGGAGKRFPCQQCPEHPLRRVTGRPFTKYIPNRPPIDQYEVEWVYYRLECGHDYLVRKTGKERDREI